MAGPAIGLLPGISLTVGRERLGPNEVLTAFTDGVIEAQNGDGDFFTRERLEAVLAGAPDAAAGLGQAVLQAVKRHTGDTDPYDDLTLLAVRRAGGPAI